MSDAQALIEKLDLKPHPEGGWFKETWRDAAEAGVRSRATCIHFLLQAGQRSHWHTVDASEIWLYHSGDPLKLSLAESDAGPIRDVELSADVLRGGQPHHVIKPHEWQAAEPMPGPHGYTLVSCIVAPAFEFEGFTLADTGWEPGA
ncbi:cupin domain-containing protein [Altericroceibacterium endophyticum]|uniref:Cupin n=1 Tax=Altericroceibacterium endophyticum TaxID=1808508 RepID=A0A6I4T7N4_9SPHN|nr:cupin domain-containing protein [Altericroceibacterium endophyticum]MXO66966.1 cupin [Altericroceibacterium endophyticum]